jgi:plasmid maintenance system antidote protein VapI
MALGKYLNDSGTSQRSFGQLLTPPVTQGQMSQWIRGTTRITLDYALQIDALSNVSPTDCAAMFKASPLEQASVIL